MASDLAKILELDQDQQESLELSTSKFKSLAEWFTDTSEALKENPLLKTLGTAGEAAKEWSGTVKALSKVLDKLTKERSPLKLGWLACTLAYRQTAEEAIRHQGPPQSHLPYSGALVAERLAKLRLQDPSIMTGFSLASAAGHPFVRAADAALLLILEVAGYDLAERRKIIRAVRSSFTAKLQEILSGEQSEKYPSSPSVT